MIYFSKQLNILGAERDSVPHFFYFPHNNLSNGKTNLQYEV
jgi:hypothetical protein